MFGLFQAKWPLLARIEVLLLAAAACGAGYKLLATLPAVSDLASFESDALGLSPSALTWGFVAFMLAGPFLGAMLVADRVLAARRGYVLLSVQAVLAWAGFAAVFSGDILAGLPAGWHFEPGPLSFAATAAMTAASAALLVHARPIWTGARGDGIRAAPGGEGSVALAAVCLGAAVVLLGTALIRFIAAPEPTDGPVAPAPERAIVPERAVPLPRPLVPGGEASAVRRRDGAFVFQVLIDDHAVPMVFDTGASRVTLRAEDAARLGIPMSELVYSIRLRTANGIAEMAPVTIGRMSVGSVTVANVPAVVAREGTMMQESLMGQSFLERLKSYDVQGNRVTLHGK